MKPLSSWSATPISTGADDVRDARVDAAEAERRADEAEIRLAEESGTLGDLWDVADRKLEEADDADS